jgi:hypothetical protein
MALDITPVNRNLHTRATFMSLEFEDLFVVLGVAAVMNVVSRFATGNISAFLQYGVPLSIIPLLMVFKYGKPRGYLKDLLFWYAKPHRYCAAVADSELRTGYVRKEEQ